MLIEHQGCRPSVDPTAYVAPTAVLCGDVHVGADTRILFGATLTAEGGPVRVGGRCIIMEGALIRGTRRQPATIGDHVLVGPRAYLSGCEIGPEAFVATGASVFNGAVVEPRAEVRINAIVHVNTRVVEGQTVPIGWIAVGNPAELLPPESHDRIWEVQRTLDFPGTVFGLVRPSPGTSYMKELTARYARALGAHRDDKVVGAEETPVPDSR